jgi:DNA adenine methylase
MANPKNYSPLDVGFATFFLNRTNRSGILLGGVIGGKKQDGKWLLDSRFNKSDLISRIQRIAKLSSKISLYNVDAIDLIDSVLPKLPKKTLVYLDPPYYVQGKALYQNHYMHKDHFLLSEAIEKKLNLPWVVSYDHTPEIVDMYKWCKGIGYEMRYSAQKICKGSELMFFSNKLNIKDKEVVI